MRMAGTAADIVHSKAAVVQQVTRPLGVVCTSVPVSPPDRLELAQR